MRRALRASAIASLLVVPALLAPRVAHATGVMEFPDNGSEQEARGGAWVARASDPLATFYNPAGLAGQPTRLTLQANISTQNTCFTRVKAAGDTTPDGTAAGGTYPQVCQAGNFFPDPQLAFTYHLNDRIGLGIAVLGPSAVGNVSWPDFINGSTLSPQRYLLINSNVVLLTPTIGVGWEVIDGLRLGASFIFGTAPTIDFTTAAAALSDVATPTSPAPSPTDNDIRAELKAKDIFIPGFTLGGIWSPAPELDVAAWFKYMAPITASGDITTQAFYYKYAQTNPNQIVYGDTAIANCNNPMLTNNPCGNGNNASVKVPLPAEAKLGVRYHKLRPGLEYDEHVREPMMQDVFDVEADFTWANDSAFDALQLRFPSNPPLPANPQVPGNIPPNADVPHHFRDVFGVRIGGDYNVLPDQLTVRAGGFYESQAADPTYQNIDFDGASRFGLALGGQYRVHIGRKSALDIMAGFGHVFFATLNNTNPGAAGVPALSGEPCPNAGNVNANGTCGTAGTTQYRTAWPVNLGTITSSINVINVGVSYRF
jgi:long-subunit fatty acid transport protein